MSDNYNVAICAIAKNEAPYLPEWVLYHKLVGFDKIHVFDNSSNDNTGSVLKKMEDLGLVSCMSWNPPPQTHIQRSAYTFGLGLLRANCEWICFIDIDEFVVMPEIDNIKVFIKNMVDFDALGINWKMFGTSNKEVMEPGLVIERFTKCSVKDHRGNLTVKTLAKTAALIKPNLHNHIFADGVIYQSIDKQEILPGSMYSQNVNHDKIRINHYFTKSREEWNAKVARGRATKPVGDENKFRKEEHFRMHNKNDEEDLYMLKFVNDIKSDISRFNLNSEY